jgi:hypothetical protein
VGKFLDSFADRKGDLPRSRLEDLVGEAAQNALDAALDPSEPVDIAFEVMSVDPNDQNWRDLIGEQAVAGKNLSVLRVSNRNAKGLGGAWGHGPPEGDYQKFMGFDGDSSKSGGGGSYGYGRSTYFTASRSHRLLVDSVYKDPAGVLKRRLVGVRFMTKEELAERKQKDDEDYAAGKKRPYYCDGIEVWGDSEPDDVVRPIEDSAASTTSAIANLATSMKLHRHPEDLREGTDFYVLDLEDKKDLCDPHAPQSLEEHIMGALFWRLWPALQDAKATAGVTQNGVRTEIVLDPSKEDLWPIFAFSQLRDYARGKAVNDTLGIGGFDLAVYTPSGNPTHVVRAASYTLRSARSVEASLKAAYPGKNLWLTTRTEGVVSVARFRANKLVVNYENHVPCAQAPVTVLKAPSNKHAWTLGVLEVEDPALSEDIRSGRKTKNSRGRKIEDVSHTDWSFASAMQGFEAIAEACKHLADHIGRVAASPTIAADQSGAAFWSRGLGELFPARRGAPGKEPGGGNGPGGGSTGSGEKQGVKKLQPLQPRVVAGSKCYVFDTAGLDVGSTYVLTVETQSVNGDQDTLPDVFGFVLEGENAAPLVFDSFTSAAGQIIAVKMPEPAVAVTVTAKLQTSSQKKVTP